jgi:pimeloyl-ACP methyl ester carboxylesterase
VDESKLRHDVRKEIIRNSGDTTWVTDAVIRNYTAGQTADLDGSIDAFHRMSKSKERESLADRLHQCAVPVRLLVGTVSHPAEVTEEQRELLEKKIPDFSAEIVRGAGQYIQEEQPAAVLAAVARLEQAAD